MTWFVPQAEHLDVTHGGMQGSPEHVLSGSRISWLEVLAASWPRSQVIQHGGEAGQCLLLFLFFFHFFLKSFAYGCAGLGC